MVKAKHMRRIMVLASIALILSLLPGAAAWADIMVIANSQTPITSLDRQELREIYLNPCSRWPNNMKIKRAMLTENGPCQEFCQNFLGRSTSQLERHWRRQLYTGKGLPPAELKSSSDVINYIRATPGALGFIARQPRPEGVVVLTITP